MRPFTLRLTIKTKGILGYVRRMKREVTTSEETNATSNMLNRENCKSITGTLDLTLANRAGALAHRRNVEPRGSARRTVKSFRELSVRVSSSGNSAATIPHKSRHTNAEATALPLRFRFLTIE
jgi:hypothetical protein